MSEIKVEYIGHMGDDLTVANAARVSMDKESHYDFSSEKTENWTISQGDGIQYLKLSDRDKKLISYLARENHFTPFTHVQITLRYTVPIFVARQEFKHVVGFTRNEVSRRYVDNPPEFFEPKGWRKRAPNVKQGSSDEVFEGTGEFCLDTSYKGLIDRCCSVYQEMLDAGVALEMARMVLPQSMMTSYYVTGSLYGFARFFKLRSDPHAQAEIRELADKMACFVAPLCPASWEALLNAR